MVGGDERDKGEGGSFGIQFSFKDRSNHIR